MKPRRLFLDTNVYIIGSVMRNSAEGSILEWLGFFERQVDSPTVLVSEALIEQILRVGRRVGGKDYGGELVNRLWANLSVEHVILADDASQRLIEEDAIPREDIFIFLTALVGGVDCFVSANYRLIKALATTNQLFECLTPAEFVARYIESRT